MRGFDARRERADRRQQHQDDQPARRQHHARLLRGIAHHDLQILGQQHRRAVQHQPERQHHRAGDGEVALAEQVDVDDRVLALSFAQHERHQRDAADDREAGDERRLEPVVFLALVEHDFERAETDRDQREAQEVDRTRSLARVAQVRRIRDHARREQQRHDADRDVDEEDPAPRVVVGDEAAQRWSDRRRQHHRHAVDRERHPALRGRKRVGHDRLLAGRKAAARRPLQHAEEDQQRQRRCQAAQQRAGGEPGDAGHVEPLAADAAREPSADRQHDRVRDQVRRQDPGALVGGDRQAARDMRQRRRWRCWCPAPP